MSTPCQTQPASVELQTLERVIERGLQTFREVGDALAKIDDGRLWHPEYASFSAYLRERWGWSRFYGWRLITAAGIAADLLPIGNISPESESQVRHLARLETGPLRQQAWARAVEIADGKQPTQANVEEAVEEIEEELAAALLAEAMDQLTPEEQLALVSPRESRSARNPADQSEAALCAKGLRALGRLCRLYARMVGTEAIIERLEAVLALAKERAAAAA